MTVQSKPRIFPVRLPKRLVLAGLFTWAMVSTGQAAADAISLTGNFGVTVTALGPAQVTGAPSLSYATAGPVATVGATKRAVTVRLLQPLPPGVTITVRFLPDAGNGLSTGTITLSTAAQVLVDLIEADVEQTTKTLEYSVYASKGFSSLSVNIEYVLIDK